MKNGFYKDEYGTQEWWVNGKLHREDGPAVIWSTGHQEWWVNGNPHREDGPAVIHANGTQEWWVNDKNITDEVIKWFKLYNLTYETMDDEERLMLKFNMLLFSKNK